MIYIECPHCHAIFSSPGEQKNLPERVRCGECNTVFLTDMEKNSGAESSKQTDTHATDTPSSDPLTVEDFLTSERAEAKKDYLSSISSAEAEDPISIKSKVDNDLEEIQSTLIGDNYDIEPEIELPDLNLMSSAIPDIDDPLKNYGSQAVNEDESEDDNEDFSEAPDDETADLISDRLEDEEGDDQEVEREDELSANEVSLPEGLPEIQDELVQNIATDAATPTAQDVESNDAGDASYEKFRVYLESVSMAEDERDPDLSITSEISAFIDDFEDGPENLYSQDQTETEIESQFLDLDDNESDFDEIPDEEPPAIEPDPDPEQSDFVEELELENQTADQSETPEQSSLLAEDNNESVPDTGMIDPELLDQRPLEDTSLILDVPEDQLIQDYKEKVTKPVWPYLVGGLLLIVLLALQYVYAHREQFAEYPETRGMITGLCAITGCIVSPQEDITAIQLLNHAVYSHPTQENALIIKALIRNRAKFPQPYPIIELTLADLNDKRVALRRFGPGEYLTIKPEENELMQLNSNVPVQLQVLDPGQDAVAFEFEFL